VTGCFLTVTDCGVHGRFLSEVGLVRADEQRQEVLGDDPSTGVALDGVPSGEKKEA
jgi:hypothetical protein